MDYDSSDQLTVQRAPFSTRTLGFQTLVLSFLSVWIFAVLIPSTLFSRTRSAHLTIKELGFAASQISSSRIIVYDPKYWDYGFCECISKLSDNQNIKIRSKVRCLASAPWFSLIFSLPASIVTWVAWKSQLGTRSSEV